MIGKTLSHYRITAALGAGGMGEVYRATDTNLGREVAIKVLPPEVARDPERLARFRREAQLLAALNHPNIAAIYGLEEADGEPFLALELVEGEDLGDRLKRGAIPVDEALGIARQITEALEAAHDKGIVHRDLKPANVKLTPDGKVKVLDFGLAKAWTGDPAAGSSADLSQSPTLARTGTAAGVILGTAAYMSPEQARGKPTDKRTDIWAFGAVLFEMLTGRPLFSGETVSDVIAAVVRDEPEWASLPGSSPPSLRRFLRRCLEKDPGRRTRDVADARLELEDVRLDAGVEAGVDASAVTRNRGRALDPWAWLGGLLVGGALATVLALRLTPDSAAPRPVHFTLTPPESLTVTALLPVVSPDGRHVVFAGITPDSSPRLWIRSLASPGARALPGTDDGYMPFWSPDSASLAFATPKDLKRVVLDGGGVQTICKLPETGLLVGGTWSDEGTIVFSHGPGRGRGRLYRVSAAGGEPRPLTTHDESRGEVGHWLPQFLPGGRRFLFLVGGTDEDHVGLHVASLEVPDERRRILPGTTRVGYASGHLLWVRDGTLLARPFDAERLAPGGEGVPLAEDVFAIQHHGIWGSFSASLDGTLIYREAGAAYARLVWFDRSGERLGTLGDPGAYDQIALSPDERLIAAQVEGDLWVIDVDRGVPTRVTSLPGTEFEPIWSPDGQRLLFASVQGGDADLYTQELTTGAAATPLREGPGNEYPEDWSPDGDTLLYSSGSALWALPKDGGEPELVRKSETGRAPEEAVLSPDGRWLAYMSDESGRWEVFLEPFRRPGVRVQVSVRGGWQPEWRGDGRELFYTEPQPSARAALMAVPVRDGGDGLEIGLPKALLEFDLAFAGPLADNYAVTVDGQRFLVRTRSAEGANPPIHVLLDWPAMLER